MSRAYPRPDSQLLLRPRVDCTNSDGPSPPFPTALVRLNGTKPALGCVSLLIGRGVYSLTEASRLTGVPVRRIKRWVDGYHFVHRGKRQWSEPVIGTEVGRIGKAPVLDFVWTGAQYWLRS